MSDKAQAMIEELVSAAVAFGRGQLPDWQTRIERARSELKAYVAELEAAQRWIPVSEGLPEAERKEFCPNCEAETPCTHEAELYVCDICGEDFAKYIVSRNCNVSDVSITQDVLTDVKTPRSIENTNPDYYKDELYLDEDFRMLSKTYPADVSAIGVTTLIDYVEALEAELARRDEELKITDGLLKEATETIGAVIACCTYNSNDDAKIGIYGIDQKAFTRIDQFITHYNDAISAGKVSVDVKRELSDAEITRLENRFADTEACNGRLVEQVEQLTAENKRLKAVLNEWDMAWLTDCIAPQPNGNEAFGLDEGLVLCARMMKPILEETRLLLGKAEVVR